MSSFKPGLRFFFQASVDVNNTGVTNNIKMSPQLAMSVSEQETGREKGVLDHSTADSFVFTVHHFLYRFPLNYLSRMEASQQLFI